MYPPTDPTVFAALGLPLRWTAALATLWCAALLGLAFACRFNGADVRLQRSWTLVATAIVGPCQWAAHICIAVAIAGRSDWPVGGGVIALGLASCAAAASLAAVTLRHRSHQWQASAGAAVITWLETVAWAHALSWSVGAGSMLACAFVSAASQGATMALLIHWRRRERRASLRRTMGWACLPALLQVLPLLAMGAALPTAAPAAPSSELIFALLTAGMALLALQAGRVESHLLGKHQVLGAQLQQANANLQRTPFSDPLTGLLSRLGLEAALRKAGSQAESKGLRVVLLAIGLDGFKSVNDSFGHALGDSVLRKIARRLTELARELAPPGASAQTLARLGGDEFVLMLVGQLDREAVARAAARLLEVLDVPIDCEGHELRLSASIGMACFPDDGGASKLIARANAAMQAAKSAGGSAYMVFEPRMQDDARERHALLRDLRQAIENRQLELFYQPKIDARSNQVTAAEALLRWHHPLRGTLGPDIFIPLAERHGLIGALGNWVIEDACRQARVWRECGLKMRVAINLSVFQMRQNDLVERIQAALKRHGVNPSRLTCEITESVAMEDTQVTQRTFERLGQAGIHLSIDDFGTGYSSLSYLRRLPATELKIDRSFVMDLDTNADARAIVDAVLKLAHAIGLKVVAEGVETIRQRDILLELGCDEFQGYLFARPMSARALMLWAADDRAAKNAFRPSLFGETESQSMIPASSSQTISPPAQRSWDGRADTSA